MSDIDTRAERISVMSWTSGTPQPFPSGDFETVSKRYTVLRLPAVEFSPALRQQHGNIEIGVGVSPVI